ncbi:MAG TPA: type II secretion system F family protein, partial [Kineosporiaceae bacterium]
YALATPPAGRAAAPADRGTVLGNNLVTRSAVDLAQRVVVRRGLDGVLGARLEAAGLPLRTAEWLVLHVGCAVACAVLLLLLSGGGLPATAFGLAIGLAGPWLVLTIRQGRREKAFLRQLPDTLQLLAGSLRAGYSMPQALDTAVRQSEPPMAAELHRALVESRLGVPVEDALERVGERVRSDDFSWVVMAIRIQREVGGNLAELLLTVADTLRERERLRRQVDVLSAEGRLSGIILGCLPLGFAAYLLVARPEYLLPMLTPFGLVLLGTAVVLLAVGSLWVARLVTVEV